MYHEARVEDNNSPKVVFKGEKCSYASNRFRNAKYYGRNKGFIRNIRVYKGFVESIYIYLK